jgi:hypothetical protein
MSIDAVVAGVDLSADEPFPERRIARVERLVPFLVPGEHLRVLVEALRKILQRESLGDVRIPEIRLLHEFLGRIEVLLFLPVDGNLRFGQLEIAHEWAPFNEWIG